MGEGLLAGGGLLILGGGDATGGGGLLRNGTMREGPWGIGGGEVGSCLGGGNVTADGGGEFSTGKFGGGDFREAGGSATGGTGDAEGLLMVGWAVARLGGGCA